MPEQLSALAIALGTVEGGTEDKRWRYERVEMRGASIPSLKEKVVLPLLATQEQLETTFDRYLVFRRDAPDRASNDHNLVESLAFEVEGCFSALLALGEEALDETGYRPDRSSPRG